MILEANNLSTKELTRQHIAELAEIQKTADEKRAEEKKTSDEKALDEKKKMDEAILAQEEHIQATKESILNRGIQLVAGIFGKSKAVQKGAVIAESAVGIGKMVIANNTANIAALATPQAIATSGASAAPVIAFNNISTAVGVASTVAATAKALQALGGGSAPSAGGVSGGGSVRGSAPPTVAFNNTAENQIGQSVAKTQSEQPPLKVYVAESDISDAQNNVKVLVNKNVF